MRILFLAPEPFFQERGTPIAIRMLLEELATRPGYRVDVLCYHEGAPVSIPGVTIHRITAPHWIGPIRPGVSAAKLYCDCVFLVAAHRLAAAAAAAGQGYDLVQAVEEGVFIAWSLKVRFGLPYVYDMDSSIAQQLTEKWWFLKPLAPLWNSLERAAIRRSTHVIAVCPALTNIARQQGASETTTLTDISLLAGSPGPMLSHTPSLRTELGLSADQPLALYIGNLERYQGIDLLLAATARAQKQAPNIAVVVVGGTPSTVSAYQKKVAALRLSNTVFFIGARAIETLGTLLVQADILLSPRVKGINTPMKIYSYLHSGVPVLATDILTHNQILTRGIAYLAPATESGFAEGLVTLASNPTLRTALGSAARQWAEANCTRRSYQGTVHALYDRLEAECRSPARTSAKPAVAQ